jgi:hypothetical protein
VNALFFRVLETLAVGTLVGYGFTWLHVPVPWMLGSITGVLIWQAVTKRRMQMYQWTHKLAMIVLGYMIGASFTIEIGREIVKQLPAMLTATAILVGCGFLMGIAIAKLAKVSLDSAVLGTVPGGLGQMIVMADERKNADLASVAMMQTIRLLSIFFTVPFVARYGFTQGDADIVIPGAAGSWRWDVAALFLAVIVAGTWLSVRLKVPTPYFMGPIIGVIVLVLIGFHPPQADLLWINMAQVIMGSYLGATMKISGNQGLKRLLFLSIASSMLTIVICIPITFMIAAWYNLPLNTAFLSSAPGGMSEMAVVALLIGADVPVVSAYQLFRILFILFVVPPLITWFLNRAAGLRREELPLTAAHAEGKASGKAE